MANVKVVICSDETTAKSVAAMMKRPSGGGYTTIDGPFKTNSVLVETFGIGRDVSYEYADNSDGETWIVMGRAT